MILSSHADFFALFVLAPVFDILCLDLTRRHAVFFGHFLTACERMTTRLDTRPVLRWVHGNAALLMVTCHPLSKCEVARGRPEEIEEWKNRSANSGTA